jgi:hypothetical protein
VPLGSSPTSEVNYKVRNTFIDDLDSTPKASREPVQQDREGIFGTWPMESTRSGDSPPGSPSRRKASEDGEIIEDDFGDFGEEAADSDKPAENSSQSDKQQRRRTSFSISLDVIAEKDAEELDTVSARNSARAGKYASEDDSVIKTTSRDMDTGNQTSYTIRNTFIDDGGNHSKMSEGLFGTWPIAGGARVDASEPNATFETSDALLQPPGIWSLGSAAHASGTCKPCAWMYKEGENGCRNGVQCEYCHLCPPGEVKKRKRDKLIQRLARTIPKKSAEQKAGASTVAAISAAMLAGPQSLPLASEPCYIQLPGITATTASRQQQAAPLASLGSATHGDGNCKPCAWVHKAPGGSGCKNAQNCQYCHICPPGELKRRKNEKFKQQNAHLLEMHIALLEKQRSGETIPAAA